MTEDRLRAALEQLIAITENVAERVGSIDLYSELQVAAENARAALAHSEPSAGLDVEGGPNWTLEQRVKFAEDMGRIKAEQRATEALARIVAAAGGEVRVPDRLVVGDVTMAVDYAEGVTVYRARLDSSAAGGE